MRSTTRAQRKALEVAEEADTHMADKLERLTEWVKKIGRHVHEQRNQAIAAINTATAAFLAELETMGAELEATAAELRGREVPNKIDKAPPEEASNLLPDEVQELTKRGKVRLLGRGD